MSRKRGKKPKVAEAIPDDILAEGSGPVGSAAAHADAIATVEDVVTTADIATTDDVVTADDVVATAVEPTSASRDPSSKHRPIRAAEEALQEEDVAAPTTTAELDAMAIASSQGLDLSGAGNGDDDRSRAGAGDGNRDGDGYADDFSDDAGYADGGSDDGGYAAYRGSDGRDEGGNGHGEGNGSSDDGGEGDGDGDGEDDAAIVFPTSAASMDAVQLKHLVEALVFASDRPLTVQRLRQLTRVSEVRRLEQALTELAEDYLERGLVLQQVSGGYQFRTRTQFSPWVQQLIAGRPVRLSRAQLETLAIIAYRQPITRPEIDDIRGVDSSATLKLLIDRMLIRVLGKREEVGRPILYGTTKEFLDFFSLGDLRELPTLREYSELTAESRKVMSDRLGIEPDAVDVAGLGTHGNGPTRPHAPNGESHSPSNGESHSPSNGESHSPSNGESHSPSNGGADAASADVSNGDELVARADDPTSFDDDVSSEPEHSSAGSDAMPADIEEASDELDAMSAGTSDVGAHALERERALADAGPGDDAAAPTNRPERRSREDQDDRGEREALEPDAE